jgi:hypothetical protein
MPDEVLAALRPPWEPRCTICAGLSGHDPIPDEGALVCYPCILRVGRIAGDPLAASELELLMLSESHRDVVRLGSVVGLVGWIWVGW